MGTTQDALSVALTYIHVGRLSEAEDICRQVLEVNPEDCNAWHFLGVIASQAQRPDDAIECLEHALRSNPQFPEAYYHLGNVYLRRNQHEMALTCYRQAVTMGLELADAYYGLGLALHKSGNSRDAITSYQHALSLNPQHAEVYSDLGNALKDEDRIDEATTCYRKALELKPDYALAHSNLGAALYKQGRLEEAVAHYRQALQLAPAMAEAYSNLGLALQDQRNLVEAKECYERAIELQPDLAEAHYCLSTLRLLAGDFSQSKSFEWRFKTGRLPSRRFIQPVWNGQRLDGRTILLYCEQGLGDSFQFVRFANVVKNFGGRVLLECQRPIKGILSGCPGIEQLICHGDELPPFDTHAPLLSLLGILNVVPESIPGDVPYLFADPALVVQWRSRLAHLRGLRIGINWHGRECEGLHRRRDIPLQFFRGLAQISGVNLISLQKNATNELNAAQQHFFTVPGEDIDTYHGAFMDTAGIMMNLDLVISSDTSVAHLAGALGVRVWTALPLAADWRWQLDRNDSPWYPTMRLFRQKRPGDWASVFDEIKTALREMLGS